MMVLGFIGGTGPEGRGLALRFAMAGHRVLLGSREAERAREAVEKIAARRAGLDIAGVLNEQVAREAEWALVTVPYAAQRPTLEALRPLLAGKTVIDVVAPVVFENGVPRAVAVEEGSAAQQAQALLPDSQVVAAFQNVSAHDLLQPERPIDGDVIVCSDHPGPKAKVMALAEEIRGVRAVDGGALENARYVEDLTALLLNINRVYKGRSMVRITGI
ncbi:MAG: NADPH-dependent F420 reductase [Chloroflexi bacterium]|nr:NADPH-dependent F420 reductase [Chloroflexota bacterium]